MKVSAIVVASAALFGCSTLSGAAPLDKQQQFPLSSLQDDPNWPVSNAVVIQDTIEGFYESAVDEILSAQTEELLATLTQTPVHHRINMLRHQASYLLPDEQVHDLCLAKLPGYVGAHVYQLNAEMFEAISPIVEEMLPQLWPDYKNLEDTVMSSEDPAPPAVPHYQIASALYSLNQAVSHELATVLDKFKLIDRVRQDMLGCEQAIEETQDTMTDNIRNYLVQARHRFLTGLGKMLNREHDPMEHDSHQFFLQSYLRAARRELWSELEARLGDLVMTIYNDIYDQDDDVDQEEM